MQLNSKKKKNSFDMVNAYGTYNIQPTQNASNTYPAIGQGLNKKEAEKLKKEAERWKKEDDKTPHRMGN